VAYPSGNLCPAGHYCPANVGAPIRCAPGSFQDTPGQAACQDCPAGTYCPRHNMTLAAALLPPCAAGYWCEARSVVPNPVNVRTERSPSPPISSLFVWPEPS